MFHPSSGASLEMPSLPEALAELIFPVAISPHWKSRSKKNSILSRDQPLFIQGTDRIQLSKVKW